MTKQDDELREKVERYHASYCDKFEVLRGIYPNDRRLTGKECSCGYDNAIEALIKEQVRLAEIKAARNEALLADNRLGLYPDYNKMKTASLKRIDDLEHGLYISPSDAQLEQEEK